jgi:hypothetical protein
MVNEILIIVACTLKIENVLILRLIIIRILWVRVSRLNKRNYYGDVVYHTLLFDPPICCLSNQ